MAFRLLDYHEGLVELRNKFFFTNLNVFDFTWRLEGNGEVLAQGRIDNVDLPAQQTGVFRTQFPTIHSSEGVEYYLNFYASQKRDEGLLKAGTQLAAEQVKLPFYKAVTPKAASGNVTATDSEALLVLTAGNVSVGFDKATGALCSFKEGKEEMIKEALEERFGGKWQIVIRLHNRLKKESRSWLNLLPSYVSDATFYEDMQELLLCTDVGLTDYSSWIFDFVLSGKPGFIIELNLEDYENARGFYYPIDTTPFPIATSSEELADNIRKFDAEKYAKDKDVFLAARGCMEDGHASERIVEKINELMAK